MESVSVILITARILSAVSAFGFLTVLAGTYRPGRMVRIYERVDHRLREKKSAWFDYRQTEIFLKKTGATYHYGNWVEPVKYLAVRILLAGVVMGATARYGLGLSVVSGVAGYFLPKLYLIYANKKDNDAMLPEIKMIYNSLAIQIRSGVYVMDALAEIYDSVEQKRLRDALQELSVCILVKKDIRSGLKELENRFQNRKIDSLCVIIEQSMESGKAVELLADITEQIKSTELAIMAKKKAKLDRQVTLGLLGVMAAMLGVVIYACFVDMMAVALNF